MHAMIGGNDRRVIAENFMHVRAGNAFGTNSAAAD